MVTVFYASSIDDDLHVRTYFFKSREDYEKVKDLTEDVEHFNKVNHFTVPDYGNIDFATPEDFQ